MNPNAMRLAGVVLALALAGGGGFWAARMTGPKLAEPEIHAEEEAHAEGVLAISGPTLATAGVGLVTIAAGGLDAEVAVQANVAATPTGQASLTARAGGTVTRILKRLGDPVRAGETVAIVESREAAAIAADRSLAAAKATLADKSLAREKSLFDQRVSPRMDLEAAEAEAAAARAEVRRADAAAGAARITSDGRGLAVVSPINGQVSAVTASLGAFVEPSTELFRITDPRAVQVEAMVAQADAARIAPGDKAVVVTADGRELVGRVRVVTPSLDGQGRVATAILDVATAGLTPGQTAQARLFPRSPARAGAIVVPQDAVQTLEGRQVVFVRTTTGFTARPVTVGGSSGGRVEILAGLEPGQVIAAKNAFLIKAELAKGDEDEGHGH